MRRIINIFRIISISALLTSLIVTATSAHPQSIEIDSPPQWHDLADKVRRAVTTTHQQFKHQFGFVPYFETSLQLMDHESYIKSTGAPDWTTAFFKDGRIYLPVTNVEEKDVLRSAKHEYTHAILYSLGFGKIPCWIDEGFAQYEEGGINPLLFTILAREILNEGPIPLEKLDANFLTLEPVVVGPAYAQSLFATNYLLKTQGTENITNYFIILKAMDDKERAFYLAFGMSTSKFEYYLNRALIKWAAFGAEG